MHLDGSIAPRIRRGSITNAGEMFRTFFASQPLIYGSGPEYVRDLEQFMDTFIQITKSETKFKGTIINVPHDPNLVKTIILDGYTYHNVAIICLYRNQANLSSSHAVPYVKMNDRWYVGDDEKGMLVLRKNGPPTWNTVYSKTWVITGMYYFYINEILPVFPIIELNKYGFHGKIAFKQHVSSCWGDSIQTVIMNANGFREQFVHLYRLLKSTPEVFTGTPLEILEKCMIRVSNILAIKPSRYDHTSSVHRVLLLLSLSFIRMITWEPPYGISTYVDHIQGTSGLHLLQLNSSEGADPGEDIRITEPFGGKRSKRKTRKRKN
jgi:hypothetical protein